MRTIEDIRFRKNAGKKMWGRDLIHFLLPYFKDRITLEEIVEILHKEHDIQISYRALAHLKFRHGKEFLPKKETSMISPVINNSTTAAQNDQQNNVRIKDGSFSQSAIPKLNNVLIEDIYQAVYPPNKKDEFDLGDL
jgi:hypothetical protein